MSISEGEVAVTDALQDPRLKVPLCARGFIAGVARDVTVKLLRSDDSTSCGVLRSTKALLGVGFTQEGVLRHWHRHGEDYYDVNVFGMLRSDWEKARWRRAGDGRGPRAARRSWRGARGRPRRAAALRGAHGIIEEGSERRSRAVVVLGRACLAQPNVGPTPWEGEDRRSTGRAGRRPRTPFPSMRQ